MKTRNPIITKLSLLATCVVALAGGRAFAGAMQHHPLHDQGTICSIQPQSEMFTIQDRREAHLSGPLEPPHAVLRTRQAHPLNRP